MQDRKARNCTGSSRGALFGIAVSHAAEGDLDRMLEIVARTVGTGIHVPGLGSILGRYKGGGIPAGLIFEDLGVDGR